MAKNEVSIGVKLVTDLSDFKTGFQQAQDTSQKFGTSVEKNITSPLRAMEAQMRSLRATQRKAITPEEYQKVGAEIKKVQSEMDAFKGKTASVKSPIDGLLSSAKGLLPAFGFAAIAAGAGVVFQKVIAATDTLGTAWEAEIGGMSEGLNEFWRTIASGDWSNFTDRIKEAIKLGSDYVYILDDLEEKNRALSIAEADASATELKLEEDLKNKGLSLKDRLKAGQERIKLEETLAAKRVTIAQQAYEAEAELTASQTKLSKDQLLSLIKDLDSETKAKAKAYNDERSKYKKGGLTEKEIDNSLVVGKDVTESVKLYAAAYRNLGRTTDEQLNKMVEGYVKLKEAENSGAENTKKVRTMVNSLLAGEETTGQKIIDKNATIEGQLKTYKDQLEANNGTDKEAIAIIYQKIEALNKQAAAYEAVKLAIRAEASGNQPIATIKSKSAKGTLTPGAIDTKTLAVNSPINADKIESEIDRINNAQDALVEKQQAVQDAFATGFNNIGQSVVNGLGLAEDGFQGFLGGLASTVIELLAMFLAQSIGASIAGATVSGASTGPAAIFTTPAFIATAIGGVLAAFASIPKFATGGVVPGSSWSGDNVLARVNSGEEILTRNDPRHRANQSNGGGQTIILQPSLDITGDRLRVMLNRVNANTNKRT